MGCVVSRKGEEDQDVVLVCKERKKLMKEAMERRLAFAEAHCKYNHSLYAMAAAIRLFVAATVQTSSPSVPFLNITFPPNPNSITNELSMFLDQQRPTQPTTHHHQKPPAIDANSDSKVSSFNAVETEYSHGEEEEEDVLCDHFYDDPAFNSNSALGLGFQHTQSSPSPQFNTTHFGWDFFEEEAAININTDDDDFKVVREQEGIPELEEEEEEEEVVKTGNDVVAESTVSQEQNYTGLDDSQNNETELLEALKIVEDHFLRAYESGLHVSTMLEFNTLQPNFVENNTTPIIKENSSKLIQTITWSRSTSARSSSCKSSILSTSSSKNSLESRCGDLFDDCGGGMEAGSHSSTLGRLYAWEKKLYEQVKIGDQTRKSYERKCSQLRNLDSQGDGLYAADKTRAEVKDLHTRILVAIRSAESISDKIEKLRDDELHPQLIELLHGLMRNWKTMLESHEFQIRIISEVTTFNCSTYGQFCNDSHRFATLQLEAELHNWHACFAKYVTRQKSYILALNGWLSKFIAPEIELYSSKKSSSIPPCAPPLLVLCRTWLTAMDTLPDKSVMYSMKSFGKDIRALWLQQGIEQQHKKKVDGFVKEIEREERKIFSSGISEYETEASIRNRIELLAEKKMQLDVEKEKHGSSMKETQRMTVDGLQTGFSLIFESLVEFAKACVKMYGDLGAYSENAKPKDEENDSYSAYIDELSYHLTS